MKTNCRSSILLHKGEDYLLITVNRAELLATKAQRENNKDDCDFLQDLFPQWLRTLVSPFQRICYHCCKTALISERWLKGGNNAVFFFTITFDCIQQNTLH